METQRRRRRLLSLAILIAGSALLAAVSPLTEAIGFTTGAVCVWLAAVSDPWTWPIGIANNLLYLVIFTHAGLYADAGLQVVYAAISVYGIVRWRSGAASGGVRPVERGSRRELAWVGVALVAAALVLDQVLRYWTDSTVPAWDATTTAMSLAAQWLMSRRVIENWWLWIAVDVIYVPLYVYKGLAVTSALYLLFMVLCIVGLRDWRRELAAAHSPVEARPNSHPEPESV